MRPTLVAPVTALLLALPMGAMAVENQHPPGGEAGPRQGPPLGMLLERLEKLDAFIDSKEGDKDVEEAWAKWQAALKEKRPEEFKKLDSDNDGKISRDEARAAADKFQATLKEKAPEMFAKIDANGDGKISREEANAARERARKEHPEGDKPKAKSEGKAPEGGEWPQQDDAPHSERPHQ